MEINKPHDAFFKGMLSKKENAKSFLENYLPADILPLINLEKLEIEKDSFVTKELQNYFSDLLYKVEIEEKDVYIYMLFEHKSYSEKWISLQLLEYMLQIWKLKKEQKKPLPIIIPIVVYHGEEGWSPEKKLSSILEYTNKKLAKYVPDFEYILNNVSSQKDEEIKGIESLKGHRDSIRHKIWRK